MTGTSILSNEIAVKRLEMLISIVPNVSRVAVLWNPTNIGNASGLGALHAAALRYKIQIVPVEVQAEGGVEKAFRRMSKEQIGAFVALDDTFLTTQKSPIAKLGMKHRLPGACGAEYAEAGVLMSYGPNLAANYRRAATYVDKILKGASPRGLPVEQPTKYELILNRKAAMALGLEFPPDLLMLADKVIE